MNKSLRFRPSAICTAVAITLALTSPAAFSQDTEEELLEEVITTGTRKEGLSPTETMSPVDVLSGTSLSNQATFDMTDGLTKVTPSLNTQRFPIADGTAFIRPVTLRHLSPDHTLVLVNGTRRHRSPLVNLQLSPLGTVNTGSQAVDFSAIPALAVQRVEILRDGASAQYGSDAIAGVVNVILKDYNEGFTVAAQTGEYFEGDGARTSIAANGGFSLGSSGFINATIEYSTADQTSRGIQRYDCQDVIDQVGASETPFNGLCQRWGDPDVETLKLFVNLGVDINDTTEFFANVSYSDNETRSDFFYRNPVILDPAASTAGSGRSTLIVDANSDFVPDPAPQSLVDAIVAGGGDPNTYLTADPDLVTNPSGFVLLNPIYTQFPGGYNPDFGADISDYAVVAGVRGEMGSGMTWDVRGRIAESEAVYILGETINPSLGSGSPTDFKPGGLTQEESALTVDFVMPMDNINLAFGAEFRQETYKIKAGDPASIEAGPTTAFFGVGSDGFQGFPNESAGSFDSDSIGAYVDLEMDVSDRFSLGAAARFEDYDEFGNTFNWKLSGRFEISDRAALRATVSTGFRAPTPGQVNTLNVTTSSDSSGNLIPFGTYPVDHPIALALGSTPLDPEESTSFTIGAVFQPLDNLAITLDYYDIQIEDRLTILENEIGPVEVALLTAAGIPNAALLNGSTANYFVNGFESNIQGVDLALTVDFEIGGGDLIVDLRHNWNEQEVKNVTPSTLNASTVADLENQVPNNRTLLTFNYQTGGMFGGFLRLNNFGGWGDSGGQIAAPDASEFVKYGGEILVDLEAQFRFNDMFSVAVGGENVFDVEPENDGHFVAGLLGVNTALTSPFGNNGGFWYVRLQADF
ncbi:MAG: TonB-dependent receptor plug domain-containing protein [Woeseiaceae bacterium]|nr:TonB-dependent receptor plug domain-containing protein [Woeseiaceae bacterium]